MAVSDYTIDDIAKELGVSKTTVSRAISGKGRIGPATRQRVLDFIKECGYHPNAVAKGLAKSRTYNIGVTIPEVDLGREFQFFRECLMGICSAASERDYDVLVTVGEDEAQLRRILENGKVDGFIAARGEENSAVTRLIEEHGTPFVIIGPGGGQTVHVDNANEIAAARLTEHLIDAGARRLAMFGGSRRHLVTQSREEGFRAACGAKNVELCQVILELTTQESVDSAVDRAAGARADAIVCMDDAICQMTMQSLGRRGITPPEDMAVACLYDSFVMEHMSPAVTAVRFDGVGLGRAAGEELIKLIEGEGAVSRVLPQFDIIIRNTSL